VALGDFIGSLQFYPWRERMVMPQEEAIDRAREDARQGKSPSTQASEFVREEIEHVREGKHGARSPQQAIAIGLSKARRAGIKLSPPRRGSVSGRTRKQAMRDSQGGRAGRRRKPSAKRSRAVSNALRRESRRTASRASLSAQTRSSARRRGAAARHAAARKAVRTKGRAGLRRAARKAARTRRRARRA
jgi:hypothetical protein